MKASPGFTMPGVFCLGTTKSFASITNRAHNARRNAEYKSIVYNQKSKGGAQLWALATLILPKLCPSMRLRSASRTP